MDTTRRVSIGVLVAVLTVVVIGAVIAWWYMPQRQWVSERDGNQWQRIGGIDAGNADGYARIPRRALHCVSDPANGVAEACETLVDGTLLTVRVEYNVPSLLFRACRISYGVTTNHCVARSANISGPIYAGAFASDPGLTGETREAIRRRYPFDNITEATAFAISRVVAGVLAVCIALVVFTHLSRRVAIRVVAAATSCLAAFFALRVVGFLFLLFTTYVD